ncbi:hypothetical protein F4780DRAFT_739295 [Xylariomycetidae sp. FL0641]|nr:hypothetical protein F4780DRAFT_739295 [Xylariomycetidae sp. FL0641]
MCPRRAAVACRLACLRLAGCACLPEPANLRPFIAHLSQRQAAAEASSTGTGQARAPFGLDRARKLLRAKSSVQDTP